MTPDEYCQQKANIPGSAFYYSVLFVEPLKRRAITALEALRCELADVVHHAGDENAARIKLAWWRHELGQMYAGNPQHLVTRALLPSVERWGIVDVGLDAMIDAYETDLLQTRYLDFQALEQYASRMGGEAQRASATVLTGKPPPKDGFDAKIGLALQLGQLMVRVGDDARAGRVYLPVSEMQRFNVPVADILNARHSANFEQLMRFQYDRVIAYCESALHELAPADRKSQRATLCMANIQRALWDEIRRDHFQVLSQKTALTPLRMLWVSWKTWVAS